MTINHRPATALPWKAQNPRGHQRAIDRKREIVSPIAGGGEFIVVGEHTGLDCLGVADAAYIAHAANAYPRLVRTLKRITQAIPGSQAQLVQIGDAAHLLRELGEE